MPLFGQKNRPLEIHAPLLRNGRRGERGNTLLETALGVMPLLALFFGLMDFSLIIFLQSSFQNAVSAGVRFAVTYSKTYNGQTCTTQTDCIRKVVQDNSTGFLTDSTLATKIKVLYYSPENLDTPITAGDLPITLADGSKINYVNQPGNVIEVQIKDYPRQYMVPLPSYMPGSGISLTATVSDVLQGLPIGTLTPPAP